MNEIDRYLDQACHSVSGPISLRKHLRAELKEHLEEAIKELVAHGISEAEATRKVLDDFGEPELVREGLQSVYGHSVTSLFVDKAMQWKEKTMKSKWTWNMAVHFGLLLTIVAAVSCSVFVLVWIVPLVAQLYSEVGAELPIYMRKVISLFRHLFNWWWAWLGAIAILVGLFEWKCKSENKSLIRATMSVVASMLSVGLTFYLTIATIIVLALLPQVRVEHWNKSFIVSKVASAERSYQRLASAIEQQNWAVAEDAAYKMKKPYRTLDHWDTMAIVLPSEPQYEGVKEIRTLIDDVTQLSDEVRSAILRHQHPSVIQKRFTELKEAYSKLKRKSNFFATHTAAETSQQTDEKKLAEKNVAVPEPEPETK